MIMRSFIVDYYNNFIRSFSINPVMNENGEHFGGTFGFLQSLKYSVGLFKPNNVIIVSDGPNAGLRRRMILKEYKENRIKEWRPGKIRSYDFLSEEEQNNSFNFQINRLNEYLSVLPVRFISVPYVEADDIIAEIVNTNKEDEHIIYSTDGDFKQLISDKIMCYNPTAKVLWTKKYFIEKMQFLPENFIFYKMIVGDKSDGIPGINGIGPKTFIKLFPTTDREIFSSLNELLGYSDFVVKSKLKEHTKANKEKHKLLLENEELLKRNWSLMQLQDVDMSIQTKDLICELMNRSPNSYNRMRLMRMFVEDKLQSSVKNFMDWHRTFGRMK